MLQEEEKELIKKMQIDELTRNHHHPWLVAQMTDSEETLFYTIHHPLSHYCCPIPELVGRRIRASFHGWLILSQLIINNKMMEWSLWNPTTSTFIRLPRMLLNNHKHGINGLCLTSPPHHPASILLATTNIDPTFVFCKTQTKSLTWTQISYAQQLRNIVGDGQVWLDHPICYNGKVYAFVVPGNQTAGVPYLIQVDIVNEKEEEVVINLLPFMTFTHHPHLLYENYSTHRFLKASSTTQLFLITAYFTTLKAPIGVYLHKLDMSSQDKVWVEVEDLQGLVFFLDMTGNFAVDCSPPIELELGGYVHFLYKTDKVIYSYHVKDKTISLTNMDRLDLPPSFRTALPTCYFSVWPMPEFRLQGDHKADSEDECMGDDDEMVETTSATNELVQSETELLDNVPFHVLETMMEFCVGVEYLNFRATCKQCHAAAPVIRWRDAKARKRLETYSLVSSPWLVVFDRSRGRGIITFMDPMFGDKYFIKSASAEPFADGRILCSGYGWLLLFLQDERHLAFFNPFTGDLRVLPQVHSFLQSFCFSAPPTSPDCIVVGFRMSHPRSICGHFVARQPAGWLEMPIDGDIFSHPGGSPTFCGRDVYAPSKEGRLHVFREIGFDNNVLSCQPLTIPIPGRERGGQREYFHVKCEEHDVVVVVVEKCGESVEVWKLKEEGITWERMDGIGRHVIYICGRGQCVCMDAKTPEIENRIYFARLHCGNEKIVFYSMETRRFHTSDGRKVEESFEDLSGTKHYVHGHAWIEPSWC